MNSYMLFKNYFKTSIRSLVRNRLFSFINIIGLAISMSVGLVVITLIVEVQHFDDFHENGDQIYRVINTRITPTGDVMNLATTSYFLSEKLEAYEGYQAKTTLYKQFGGDADANGKKLVISGLWASQEFFNVFTFPMIAGDPSSALADPNSLVLTETTAKKLYGDSSAMGQIILVDDTEYLVKGIIQDPPINSHIKFESLASISTLAKQSKDDPNWSKSTNMWRTYVYLTIPNKAAYQTVTKALNQICETENKIISPEKFSASLQPLSDIFTGTPLSNQLGPTVPTRATLLIAFLPLIILLTACFNYTNLSIARSLRRSTEVGIRRVVGATRGNIFTQFVVESVIISLLALLLSGLLYVPLREQFLYMTSGDGVSLPLNSLVILWFIGFAIFAGIIASLIPASTLSKFQAVTVLRSTTSVKLFAGMTLRKVLLISQFTISTALILLTIVLNKQYNHAMNYDLGFSTSQILNVELQGNNHQVVSNALAQVSDVKSVSKSQGIVHSNQISASFGKYENPADSALIHINYIDENYLKNHSFNLLAGENFKSRPDSAKEHYAIVNQKMLQRFEMGSELEALGEKIVIENQWLTILGVVEDFNHATLDAPIEPYAFRYNPAKFNFLNLQIVTNDYMATLDQLDTEWQKVDNFHTFSATFYDDHIEDTYIIVDILIQMVGFLAFLAISIAAMGLFGMSVYAVETKIKEISIRKVMGASAFKLVYLLSKSYIWLLVMASLIATPLTYILVNQAIKSEFTYFTPMSFWDVLGGLFVVFFIGLVMIGFQTYRAAQTNPAEILRNE